MLLSAIAFTVEFMIKIGHLLQTRALAEHFSCLCAKKMRKPLTKSELYDII